MPASRAFITGISDIAMTAAERKFLRTAAPWGLILFKRNIENPAQVADLVQDFRAIVGRADAPVLIDQEGGRVQRLGPPHWPVYPPGAVYSAIYQQSSARGSATARLGSRLIAADLQRAGITVDCLPIADVPVPGSDNVIGDRAYGNTPDQVAAIARAVAEGLAEGGVLPVLKHIPGHGRATADSHHDLPVVTADRATLETSDFAAFRALADLPMAMTAHVVFTAFDAKLPATTSRTMIQQVIRGFIGFDGLLMSDDVSMGALSGTIGERCVAALGAGCDIVLHCNGKMDEMTEVAAKVPMLSGMAERRADTALRARRTPAAFDEATARAEFGRLIERGWRMNAEIIAFEDARAERATDEPALIVDVEGFEGPLDLLLALARDQKVDLAKISILALANQYLVFIEEARKLRLELAADYLVMAAWLAYLKSRLLLPELQGAEGPSAADMANALALRLRRLEAIRIAAGKLFERPQLGRDVFDRGDPEPIEEIRHPEWSATLYDLLTAYATERRKHALNHMRFAKRTVWSLAEARAALERLIGTSSDWSRLDEFLISYLVEPSLRTTVIASSFAATLEMVREGGIELHQHAAFAPIYLRKRGEAAGLSAPADVPASRDTPQ